MRSRSLAKKPLGASGLAGSWFMERILGAIGGAGKSGDSADRTCGDYGTDKIKAL